jgi:hypothetical protein
MTQSKKKTIKDVKDKKYPACMKSQLVNEKPVNDISLHKLHKDTKFHGSLS